MAATREADILRSSFADNSFDVVICAQFLHHMHGVGFTPFIKEFHRMLKPGGTLAVLEPSDLYPIWRLLALVRRFMGNVTGLVDDDRLVRPGAVTTALAVAGFDDVRVRGLLFSHVRVPSPVQHLIDARDYPLRVLPGLIISNFANSVAWYCSKPVDSLRR